MTCKHTRVFHVSSLALPLITAGIVALACLLSCIKVENPYTIAEAGITIENGSLLDGDTVEVGQKYGIILGLELKEFIDRVTLDAQGNDSTLWSDTSVLMKDVWKNTLTFYIRYHTHGQKQVRIEAYDTEGKIQRMMLNLLAVTYSDTTPPLIRIVSNPLSYSISSNNDTIISINDSLPLQLKIVDAQSRLNVNSFTVNDSAFDKIEVIDTNEVFAYQSFDLSGAGSPLQINITARDTAGNTGSETYWLRKAKGLR